MWLWPVDVTFLGYRKVFSNPDIWSGYRNTIYYTVFGTLINLALTLPCAYALAKKRLPLKKLINFIILFTMFFSGGLIPLYMLVNGMQLLDTVWAVVLPTAASAYNIIIARTFMETTIPEGLEEAAEIDGCNMFQYFMRVVIPLSKAIIAIMVLYYAVGHWNSFFNALIYVNNNKLYPLQLILRDILITGQSVDPSVTDPESIELMKEIARTIKYGVIIVSSLPVLVLYPFVQKYFVKGVMIGSVKG